MSLIRRKRRGCSGLGSILSRRFLIIRLGGECLLSGWLIGLIVRGMGGMGKGWRIRNLRRRRNSHGKIKIRIRNKGKCIMRRIKNQSLLTKAINGKTTNEIDIF